MTIALYDNTTGRLLARLASSADLEAPLPAYLGAKDVGLVPTEYVWDATVTAFVPPKNPTIISIEDFIKRFTSEEIERLLTYQANETLTAGQKDLVGAFIQYLQFRTTVGLGEAYVRKYVRYLEACSILASGRAATILA